MLITYFEFSPGFQVYFKMFVAIPFNGSKPKINK